MKSRAELAVERMGTGALWRLAYKRLEYIDPRNAGQYENKARRQAYDDLWLILLELDVRGGGHQLGLWKGK
jgi:hypothetical protein